MNKQVSLVVLIVGLALVLSSFVVTSSQRTIALMCGGVVYIVIGGYGLSRKSRDI